MPAVQAAEIVEFAEAEEMVELGRLGERRAGEGVKTVETASIDHHAGPERTQVCGRHDCHALATVDDVAPDAVHHRHPRNRGHGHGQLAHENGVLVMFTPDEIQQMREKAEDGGGGGHHEAGVHGVLCRCSRVGSERIGV